MNRQKSIKILDKIIKVCISLALVCLTCIVIVNCNRVNTKEEPINNVDSMYSMNNIPFNILAVENVELTNHGGIIYYDDWEYFDTTVILETSIEEAKDLIKTLIIIDSTESSDSLEEVTCNFNENSHIEYKENNDFFIFYYDACEMYRNK